MDKAAMARLANQPLFFARNRVYRVYKGGKLIHNFFTDNAGDAPEDGNTPEEWIASDVRAMNAKPASEKEGLSRIEGTDVWLDDLIAAEPKAVLGERDSLGVLVKILDSAVRLPVQAHPDKAFSRRHFNSGYGKAECWLVLATRPGAELYFGFAGEISRAEFKAACLRSETDKNALEPLLNRVEAKPGDMYFIQAGLVHAVGYGCLIIEVQEPTDFTMQPEAWCADHHLSAYEQTLGLPLDDALECFDYSLYGDAALQAARKSPKVLYRDADKNCTLEQLIGPNDTPCFAVNRYTVENGATELLQGPAVYVVTEGGGELTMPGTPYAHTLARGSYFLLPHSISGQCIASGALQLVQCLPPQPPAPNTQCRCPHN